MKQLPLTQFGNPILRKKAKRVPLKQIKTRQFQELIKQMFFTMRQAGGVGLNAPQVGKSIQLAVIEVRETPSRPDITPHSKTVIINPKITNRSKEKMPLWEGCLSLPGKRGYIQGKAIRHKKITVQYLDEYGDKHKVNLEGLPAQAFQHEIDHLNGILFVDRIEDTKTIMTSEEYEKRVLKKRKRKGRAE